MIQLPAGTVHEIIRARREVLDREEDAILASCDEEGFSVNQRDAAMHAIGVAGALLDACADDMHLLAARLAEAECKVVEYERCLRDWCEPGDLEAMGTRIVRAQAARLAAERLDAAEPTVTAWVKTSAGRIWLCPKCGGDCFGAAGEVYHCCGSSLGTPTEQTPACGYSEPWGPPVGSVIDPGQPEDFEAP